MLLSPQRRLCSCCRTRDRISSDDSLTMASLKVMVMSSERSSGSRPASQANVGHIDTWPNVHNVAEFVILDSLICIVIAWCQLAVAAYPFQLYVLAHFGPDWCEFSAGEEADRPRRAVACSPKTFPAPGSSLAGQADCLQSRAQVLYSQTCHEQQPNATELADLFDMR